MRNIGIIARFEVRRLMKGTGGVLAFALAFVIYLWLALKLREWGAEAQNSAELQALKGAGGEALGKQLMEGAVGWFVDLDDATVGQMLGNHSPFALVFFLVALALNPLISILATFDQTGGDIATRHIRYLLLRTDRRSLYWGKVLGAFFYFSIGIGLLVGIVGAFGIFGGGMPGSEALYLVRIWITLSLAAIPFIALNAFSGALAGNAGAAFGITFAYYSIVWLISSVGSWVNDSVGVLEYLSPSAMKFSLAADDFAVIGKATLHMGVIAVLALFLGNILFQRRDV
jgi:ABC-type transport system involved in multi-copper enzyme maturation permease subunit